jgi:subtilisin family serine protease
VLIQLRAAAVPGAGTEAALAAPALESVASLLALGTLGSAISVDPLYPPVHVPSPIAAEASTNAFAFAQPLSFTKTAEEGTVLVRGELSDADAIGADALATRHPDVVGIFSDPAIESSIVCPGDPAVGSDRDVARLLSASQLARDGMKGRNVFLAIVDTGINLALLRTKGRRPKLDVRRSWTPPGVATTPGNHPVNHGTMCAYDAGIVSPEATLLDHAVLLSRRQSTPIMVGLLSDAVAAYGNLLQLIRGLPRTRRALVVSNSWGMFSPEWDFPVGHPGNYSDNPAHPFNIIVASLENEGADILFAAGNCGRDCPDNRCRFGTTRPICGANSHPRVLSVGGIDTTKLRVGYSSQGPGRLSAKKPDICTYTHFVGSGVYPEDGGTSAACPVAAGVVAAIRSKYPSSAVSPAQLRSIIFRTAEDLGPIGFDYDYGWGALAPLAIRTALARAKPARPPARRKATTAARTRRRSPARRTRK